MHHDAHTLEIEPTRPAPALPTRRACEAARRFGLTLDAPPAPPARIALRLAPGSVALITGPSGAGKSTLLNAACDAARRRGWRVVRPERIALRPAALVDQRRGLSLEGAMRMLGAAGLADAACFVRRPSELSQGQRARLALALALRTAREAPSADTPVLLAVDEFCASLDARTADAVARLLRRAAGAVGEGGRLRALVATARDDLAPALAPDTEAAVDASGGVRVRPGRFEPSDAPVIIENNPSPADARAARRALGALHYRSGRPASVAATLLARCPRTGEALGVLAVAMPTLNARWRDTAWPGAYTQRDKRLRAVHLNETLRRVARVVVDPRVRALGVATRLVRAYLESPLTARTEAVAAMGACCGFFERAGMTPWALPPSPADARLLDALAHLGVEPWRLATPRSALVRACAPPGGEALLRRELDHWSRSSRARRTPGAIDPGDLRARFAWACARVVEGAVAYTHDAGAAAANAHRRIAS